MQSGLGLYMLFQYTKGPVFLTMGLWRNISRSCWVFFLNHKVCITILIHGQFYLEHQAKKTSPWSQVVGMMMMLQQQYLPPAATGTICGHSYLQGLDTCTSTSAGQVTLGKFCCRCRYQFQEVDYLQVQVHLWLSLVPTMLEGHMLGNLLFGGRGVPRLLKFLDVPYIFLCNPTTPWVLTSDQTTGSWGRQQRQRKRPK